MSIEFDSEAKEIVSKPGKVTSYIDESYVFNSYDSRRYMGCGYAVTSSKMQYTGKSFSKSVRKLLNFIVPEKKKNKETQGNEMFPAERKDSSHYNNFFVINIFDGIVGRLLYSLNYFQFI